MKLYYNKSLIRKLFLITGVSLVLSGCSKKISDTNDYNRQESTQSEDFDEEKNSMNQILGIDEQNKEEETEEKQEETEMIEIQNVEELSNYFEDEIDFDDVKQAILENENISDKYKNKTIKIVDLLEEKTPYIDLRCLYENCKLLNIEKCENHNPNSNAAAEFYAPEHKIILYETKNHYYRHEVIHMIINLLLDMTHDHIYLNRDFAKEDFSFLSEGFTEWLNRYLSSDKKIYYTQVNDIDMIKHILNYSDEELIQNLTDKNTTYIVDSVKEYLTEEELDDWIFISNKELESVQDKSKENITSSEMIRKYKILLKAFLNSRESIDCSEKYQIMKLLSNSYSYYDEMYNDEVKILEEELENELMKYVDYTNHEIEIFDVDDTVKRYCDIDRMYLILIKNETKYMIGEQYVDIDGVEKYYSKSPYIAKESDILIPVKNLIDYDFEEKDSYTSDDLLQLYLNHREEFLSDQEMGYQKVYN